MKLFFPCFLLLFACNQDDNTMEDTMNQPLTGRLSLDITDAPVDNSQVKSCVVTIADIEIDGHALEDFQKVSVDLLAYQKGKTLSLGTFELETGVYSDITLILDFDKDTDGTRPGCYVETVEGIIDAMSLNSNKVKLQYTADIKEDAQKSLVFDVDLRKSITAQDDGSGNLDYSLSSQSEFESSIRVLEKGTTGIIAGTTNAERGVNDIIVAYAYAAGTFDGNEELMAKGSGKIMFSNAINSTKCENSGAFDLHFLTEGDYELYFASFTSNIEGTVDFTGMYTTDVLLDTLIPSVVSVSSETTTSVNISLYNLIN